MFDFPAPRRDRRSGVGSLARLASLGKCPLVRMEGKLVVAGSSIGFLDTVPADSGERPGGGRAILSPFLRRPSGAVLAEIFAAHIGNGHSSLVRHCSSDVSRRSRGSGG